MLLALVHCDDVVVVYDSVEEVVLIERVNAKRAAEGAAQLWVTQLIQRLRLARYSGPELPNLLATTSHSLNLVT